MHTISEARTRIHDIARELMLTARQVDATQCGLDQRCGNLYVGDDFLAVHAANDRLLQYYGGFEYVDASNRSAWGKYVFYSIDNDRVAEAWDQAHFNMDAVLTP
jgi:hypothetical protein